jgi:hypothetical protein
MKGTIKTPLLLALFASLTVPVTAAPAQDVTFTRDVAPILQRSCQNCHRPNSIAPMPLLTYEEVRPWARAIKQNVVLRNMPPWHIDPNVGIHEFSNSVALSDNEIATIAKWVDSGAPQGNPGDMPPPRKFDDKDRWSIGTPDLIVEMPQDLVVPAKGPDRWPNIIADPGLTEDRYIKAVELKPVRGYKTIHHGGLTLIYPDGTQAQIQEYGIGKNAETFPDGSGRLLAAGTKISFGAHLHPYGEEIKANLAVAFKFYPKGYVPKYVAVTLLAGDDYEVDLPANTDNIRTDTYVTLTKPTRVFSWEPHMHTRGKAMCMEVIYPYAGKRPGGSKVETLNCVFNFKFNWMLVYEYAPQVQPLLPAGSVIHFISWHDNTARKEGDLGNWIGFGQRTIDEMSHAWITYFNLSEEEFKQAVAERNTQSKEKLSTNAAQ